MILNPDLVYAEFLRLFKGIINNETSLNRASLLSGCLRSSAVSETMAPLCRDSSYIPLSSIIKAGLVDANGLITCDPSHPKVKSVGFIYDKSRTEGFIKQLGTKRSYSDKQKILIAISCQEAAGSFHYLFNSVQQISDPEEQAKIMSFLHHLSQKALAGVIDQLHFNEGSNTLNEASNKLLDEQIKKFTKQAETAVVQEIPDNHTQELEPLRIQASVETRITLLDELVPSLTRIEIEQQAKVRLIKVHCAILGKTLNNDWQVKSQWVSVGDTLSTAAGEVTLPYSVSQILAVITKVPIGSYVAALREIKKIAGSYESDWYTWGRNRLHFFAASSTVQDLLTDILAIKIPEEDVKKPDQPSILGSLWDLFINEEPSDPGPPTTTP